MADAFSDMWGLFVTLLACNRPPLAADTVLAAVAATASATGHRFQDVTWRTHSSFAIPVPVAHFTIVTADGATIPDWNLWTSSDPLCSETLLDVTESRVISSRLFTPDDPDSFLVQLAVRLFALGDCHIGQLACEDSLTDGLGLGYLS